MTSDEQAVLDQQAQEAIETFRRLRREMPNLYVLHLLDLTRVERVLRVDSLSNLGEGRVSDIKVQLKAGDPDGKKPFLVPYLEIDLLSGSVSCSIRDDRVSRGASGFSVSGCQGEGAENRIQRCILRAAIALMRRDGFTEPADEIEALLNHGQGYGYPRFEALYHDRILQQYAAAPEYKDNPWIHQEAMEPGQVYAFAHIPPRNFLFVKVARFVGYRDSYYGDEPRYPQTESPYLEFAVDRDSLTIYPHLTDLSCHISEHDGREYRGTVFPVPEETYRQMLTHVSPKFDRATTDVPIPMPAWAKPLDSVAACLERLHTEAFAFDEDQKYEALAFLAEHRDQLTEEVSFSVPSEPGNAFAKTKEERWQTIIANSQKSCGCGCVRKLVPICPKTGFEPNEDGNAAVGLGQTAYLIPKDGEKTQALFSISIIESGGQHYLTFLKDPFSESIDILGALKPQGYPLDQLAEAMENAGGEKPRLGVGERVYCQILTVDPAANQVWLTPDMSLRIEVEDK